MPTYLEAGAFVYANIVSPMILKIAWAQTKGPRILTLSDSQDKIKDTITAKVSRTPDRTNEAARENPRLFLRIVGRKNPKAYVPIVAEK